uniref:NAD-dependent epimerase/dehydratase domain-containing protein n=1 Tax=Oryza punctata TaxID=4537 RepID=A0A0E0M2U7_ORYPU
MASPAPAPAPPHVCVTGGGGFIASWLVKLLLSRGYAVHATLRDPCDPKNAHLERLQDASQAAPANLRLFTANVLDLDALTHAVQGCDGVFHLATPVPEDKISEVMDPAVKGTLNVLKACSVAKVEKVVVMSSNAAVDVNPDWPQNRLKDESCWSDLEFCKNNEDWYPVAKIMAEQAAFEYAKKNGLNVVTLCPPLVFGPMLQPTVNTSSKFLIYVIKGGPDVMNNKLWHMVDVRDVADALLLLYEKPESSGRYICSSDHICTRDLVNLLKKMYPKYNYLNNIPDVEQKASLTSQKLMSLGWTARGLEETLSDSVECYENAGILKNLDGYPCRLPHLFRFDMTEQPEMKPPPRRRDVCVTGAGGFVGSWLVKLLLSRGYAVHATVRDPDDPKNAFLKQLEKAPENLHLFKADVLDCGTLTAAFAGCEGAFHLATPKEMMAPTVEGTRNVLEACSAASVQKLVVVSSIAAVCLNPSWPQDMPKDENSWSDKKLCMESEDWYSLAKIEAEEMALEYGNENGLHVVTICPGIVFGPMLQTVELNTSSKALLYMINGGDGPDVMNNKFWPMVDVRDAADAVLLAYHKAGPSERYICTLEQMDLKHLLDLMKNMYPNYNYADKMVDVDYNVEVTSEKLKNLGWNPRNREETLADSVEFFEKAGLLDGRPCRLPYFAGLGFDLTEQQFQPEMPPPRRRVCVTGAGGFIGSWLVKLLLSRGYFVHGTVRNPDDPKNAFLKQLEKAPENLHLFKADVLDGGSLTAAFAGCEGTEMMAPAVKGTRNVLEACSAAGVQKLVVVSSIAAVCANPSWPQDRPKDETSWSDKKLCMETENWYSLAKTEGEEMALEYGNKNGLHVVTVCPGIVFGPMLQTVQLNTTTKALLYIIKGGHGPDIMNNKFWSMVDVRDVADALLLAYEKAGPSERYICALERMDLKDLLELMKTMYPNYNYVDKMVDLDYKAEVTSEKLKNLGWNPRKRGETFADSIEFFEKAGLLDGQPCRLPYLYRMQGAMEEDMASPPPPPRVCVTGGGGYIGSWLVKLLLSRGYAVHATLRDPCDPKNAHLKQLDGASERLNLFKADVLDSGELSAAVAGCEGVFHVASPVPADKILEVMGPAVKGTLNVLEVCSSKKVQKVVVVSSTAAVHYNPNWPPGKPKDESCWSDRNICMEKKEWYSASKVIAEKTALEYAERKGLNVVTVCPCLVFGPQLQPTVNISNELLIYITKGGPNVMKNILCHIVDVRDVAEALLLVYEKPESSGRYLCAPYHISPKAIVDFLKNIYPNSNYVNSAEVNGKTEIFTPISSEKLKSLGWKPRKLEETLTDSIEYYEKTGILQDAAVDFFAASNAAYGGGQWGSNSTGRRRKASGGMQPEMPPPPPRRRVVCVTGAGGFIGSWLVKLLLSRGYAVHATVRDPDDPKNAFLKQLENAPENLRQFKADVLDGRSLTAAFAGCEGVFHPATPVPEHKTVDPEKEMLAPAVKGTRNVLEACSAASVQKLVVVSSIGAVCFNPSLPRDRLVDETCWSDKKSCKENEVRNRHFVFSISRGPDAMSKKLFPIVDVRDVADALLLVYDKAGPSERYICSQEQMDMKDLLDLMKSMYPDYSYTLKVVDVDMRVELTSEKLKNLGWKPRKLEETLADSVESYKKAGFVDDEPCRLPHIYQEEAYICGGHLYNRGIYTEEGDETTTGDDASTAAAASVRDRRRRVRRLVGSWLVKLLSRGYAVPGAVGDDPGMHAPLDRSLAFVEMTSEKLKKLGWKPRKLEETLVDSVESYMKAGLVDDEPCRLHHVHRMPDPQE